MILHHERRIGEYNYQCRHYAQGWQEHTLKPLSRSSGMTLGLSVLDVLVQRWSGVCSHLDLN